MYLSRFSPAICLSKYVCVTAIEYKHHPRRTTDHNDWPRPLRRTLTDHEKMTDHDVWPRYGSAPFWLTRSRPYATFDIRGHVWVKVFIVLLSANVLRDMFAVKKMCLYASFDTRVHGYVQFRANFPLVHPMWRVSTKLYQLRDVMTCKFSLKRRISALVWLT